MRQLKRVMGSSTIQWQQKAWSSLLILCQDWSTVTATELKGSLTRDFRVQVLFIFLLLRPLRILRKLAQIFTTLSLSPVSFTPLLSNITANFIKIWKGPNWILRGPEETDTWKNPQSKISYWRFTKYFIQHCFICSPQCRRMLGSNSRLYATLALAVRRYTNLLQRK